jgi:hypothetical protein
MDLLHFDPHYKVVVYRLCQCAVVPKEVRAHLKEVHYAVLVGPPPRIPRGGGLSDIHLQFPRLRIVTELYLCLMGVGIEYEALYQKLWNLASQTTHWQNDGLR